MRIMRSFILVFAAVFLFAVSSFAIGVISGKVVNSDGSPARNCKVVVNGDKGPSYRTTAEDGTFSLKLEPGRYTVTAFNDETGSMSDTKEIVLAEDGSTNVHLSLTKESRPPSGERSFWRNYAGVFIVFLLACLIAMIGETFMVAGIYKLGIGRSIGLSLVSNIVGYVAWGIFAWAAWYGPIAGLFSRNANSFPILDVLVFPALAFFLVISKRFYLVLTSVPSIERSWLYSLAGGISVGLFTWVVSYVGIIILYIAATILNGP